MSHRINLEEVDVDGAVREAEHEVAGDTRLSFLRKAGMTGGAAVTGGAVLSAVLPDLAAAAGHAKGHGRPPRKFGKGDVGILNYALTLEYLERAFYNEAVAKGAVVNPQLRAFLNVVAKDENAHVSYLQSALKEKAVPEPKFNFMGTTGDQGKFAATAQVLENTGVAAYFGQGLNIKSAKVVAAAVSILTIEARHSGAIGLINDPSGEAIAVNGPFDKPKTAGEILAAVASTGFIVG